MLQSSGHVLVQAEVLPSVEAVSAIAAAAPVMVMTFSILPDDGRMQCGRSARVGTKHSAAVRLYSPTCSAGMTALLQCTFEALPALLECTSKALPAPLISELLMRPLHSFCTHVPCTHALDSLLDVPPGVGLG